jgi:uncharacterized protein YbjQ (UPF0145 family)
VEIILQNFELFFFLLLVSLGYVAGTWSEKSHYRSIIAREQELLKMPVITTETHFPEGRVKDALLVTGSVVISNDYFKRLLAILRNFFGGRVKSYESLVDRARREAILRMKEAAQKKGAGMVVNLRLETAAIGQSANKKRQVGSIEVIAYGTAIVYSQQ